ncbi:hypothetical protein MUP01_01350 [Candidatus Bathyarchaeota archaeon]|nr:hypothetical protein [Candidatus Bathyarchaeota archaeon]
MHNEEVKLVTKTLSELGEGYSDLLNAVKGTVREVKSTKKLWREGNKSRLIKLGLALIVFPEPTPISETVGACFVAAGAVKKGIQNRSIYIEDVNKIFKDTVKEILPITRQ